MNKPNLHRLSEIQNETIFVLFLQLLRVKHTKEFANKLYEEHPYKNTLFGLYCLLKEYGIKGSGLRINNKDELSLLSTPFIAYVSNSFGLVYRITEEKVNYISNGIDIQISQKEFKNIWDGVVLIAEPDDDSCEPEYEEHRKASYFSYIQKLLLFLVVITILGVGVYLNPVSFTIGTIISLLLNITGIYITYLLLLKQLQIKSESADKICSLFKKSDCNNVLESPAAKFMGLIGWSEVGFGYFMGNLLALIFVPGAVAWLGWINIATLPYTFWSIWYQKYKAQNWCPLCIIVQVLLWCLFIINLSFGYLYVPAFSFPGLLLILCLYAIPFLSVSILLPHLGNEKKSRRVIQEMSSLKMKDEVFAALLNKQPSYSVSSSTSGILFGNRNAELLVTILSNPHCNPCARMHPRVDTLLEKVGEKICVQYIFSSFDESLDDSNKFLIASYLNNRNKPEVIKEIYAGWFAGGSMDKEIYFNKYPVDITTKEVLEEFNKHVVWKKESSLRTTPTVLMNGYQLPNQYNLEEILYFTDLKFENRK